MLAWLDPHRAGPGPRSIVAVAGERRTPTQTTGEVRYYLSSLPADAVAIAEAVRGHWGIENRRHWVLNLAFREDECRIRCGHAGENVAVPRHIALNLPRREQSLTVGLHAMRLARGWDETYLPNVIAA